MNTFLPDQTHISQVHLRTRDLKSAVAFYTNVLGLTSRRGPGTDAVLSGDKGPGLLVLTEDRNAPAHPPHTTGLFHFALRYPTRPDLARAFRRLIKNKYPIGGASDHAVSEAIYLRDPDGNGVELYADRPRSQWPWRDGQVAMVTRELDLDGLLEAVPAKSSKGERPGEADLGHIHLHVADLTAAERFYSEFLGLAVTQRTYPGALFLSAGGYHHHLGVNTWAGKDTAPTNSVGLVSYRFEVPVAEILYCLNHRAPLLGYETRSGVQEDGRPILQVRDPNGNWLEVQPSSTAAAASQESPCRLKSLAAKLLF